MSLAKQARILDDGATRTNKRILRDRGNGVTPHEETLTQNFVSDYVAMVRRAKLRASVNEFTRWQEANLYGADLALWFVNAAGTFAGVHLQAKVLRTNDTYVGLDHRNSRGRQHDMLISGASQAGVLAGYAFYNGLRGAEPTTSACTHGYGAPDVNGISIASATAIGPHVARTVRRKNIEHLCSPLSCLVRHGGSAGGTSGPGGGLGPGGPGGGLGSGGPGGPGGDLGSTGSDSAVIGSGVVGASAADLPSAILGLAEAWHQPEARLHDRGSVPDFVRGLADRLDERTGQTGGNDYPLAGDDPNSELTYLDSAESVEWSDVSRFVTAVLVGPIS